MVPFELALGFEAPADGVEGEGDAGAADVSLFLLAPAPKSLLKSPIELLWVGLNLSALVWCSPTPYDSRGFVT